MSQERHTAEEIITKLREADVLQAKGQSVLEACRQIGVSEQTYYNWRKEYGGMRVDQAKPFKQLEQENARLKRLGAGHRHRGLRALLHQRRRWRVMRSLLGHWRDLLVSVFN